MVDIRLLVVDLVVTVTSMPLSVVNDPFIILSSVKASVIACHNSNISRVYNIVKGFSQIYLQFVYIR